MTELPMAVSLTGSEPYFSDFALEAAEAMELLGIKRSRLSQISGRELRVGRVKKGRYIVPVYRKEDLEQYQHWSKVTATAQKSSQFLMDAATELAKTVEHVEVLHEPIQEQVEKVEILLMQKILILEADLQSVKNLLKEQFKNFLEDLKSECFAIKKISQFQEQFFNEWTDFRQKIQENKESEKKQKKQEQAHKEKNCITLGTWQELRDINMGSQQTTKKTQISSYEERSFFLSKPHKKNQKINLLGEYKEKLR